MKNKEIIEVGGKRYMAFDAGCRGCAFIDVPSEDRKVDNWRDIGCIGQPDACGLCIDRNIFVEMKDC